MNSEIEYENFIKNIDLVIYDKIDIDNWNISIDLIFEVVEFLQKSLEELRTIIIEHPFESKEEEIYFFKYIKPEVLGRLLYFTDVYNAEKGIFPFTCGYPFQTCSVPYLPEYRCLCCRKIFRSYQTPILYRTEVTACT